MSTYQPQPGIFVGRPPCANCGANIQLHTLPPEALAETVPITVGSTERRYLTSRGLQALLDAGVALQCPTAYRPPTLQEAVANLERAREHGNTALVFAARGEVQRLLGRDHGADDCAACRALG